MYFEWFFCEKMHQEIEKFIIEWSKSIIDSSISSFILYSFVFLQFLILYATSITTRKFLFKVFLTSPWLLLFTIQPENGHCPLIRSLVVVIDIREWAKHGLWRTRVRDSINGADFLLDLAGPTIPDGKLTSPQVGGYEIISIYGSVLK